MHLEGQTRRNLLLERNHTMVQLLSQLALPAFQHYIKNLICQPHLYFILIALTIGVIIYQVRLKRISRPGWLIT
nr:hypothetical protein Iba_chr03aCG18400 [Ipomoea batatas]GME19111.1 hypothetical protein Iba_scaffold22050CG0420 [Ipomoea batatas]